MSRKILIFVLIIIGATLLCASAFIIFSLVSKAPNVSFTPTVQSELDELMAIVKKSPDYPDFLRVIKANDFDAELVEYYNFSPEVYSQKMAEWEESSNGLKEYKAIFDAVELNNNSFFVKLKSKSNFNNGLIAILDMAKKESQVIVATMQIDIKVGM